jgi:putative ABC transport system permease protein
VKAASAGWPVLVAVAGGGWRYQPGRVLLSVLGIACGIALGVAVHLINASAANELDLAVRSLSGEADLLVRGPRSGFPDALYARIARLDGVRAASPALEVDAQLAGRRETIKVLGLDPFRAREVQPNLLAEARDSIAELLKGDGVLLSRAAADGLALGAGDTLRLQAGTGVIALRVIEVLPAGATQQRLAIMDIASAQWRLGRLGELHRIDLNLAPGTRPEAFREQAAALLPPGVLVMTPEIEAERSASLARAYRTNLDMLALVALVTGAFLVFSTQFLALLRRRTQLALLRVVGLTRTRLLRLLVAEGAIIGVAGSALGIALGCALAQFGIERLGGDLGAGYFQSVTPGLHVSFPALIAYFCLGVAFAALGAAVPAIEASRRAPALALKAGDEEAALQRLRSGWLGLALVVGGLAISQAPPVHGLPVFGYVAIALMLVGTVLSMPRFAEWTLARLPPLGYTPGALAAAQLQATPRQAAISLAAIVASFSLMVSMVIMTGSFRQSLEAWLDRMLPADLYVRAGRVGESGYFTREEQARITVLAGVREALFVRAQNVLLRADRPAVTLIARPFADGRPRPPLPLEGPQIPPRPNAPPAWLSEVAADLLGLKPGDTLALPIGAANRRFTVAGVWRDYARQNGAVVIDRALYAALSGDARANEAALYLEPSATFDGVAQQLRTVFSDPEALEIASTRELKAISLSIFDRTFAVTYALETAAVLIGLFGVSASFSAQALARRREFGVLRHVGMTRRGIAAMLGCEGLIVGTLGVAAGLALGWLISLVLIHVINRQSFHWSMDMHPPWIALAALAAALIAAASFTAVVSGRRAMSDDVTRAVREDW